MQFAISIIFKFYRSLFCKLFFNFAAHEPSLYQFTISNVIKNYFNNKIFFNFVDVKFLELIFCTYQWGSAGACRCVSCLQGASRQGAKNHCVRRGRRTCAECGTVSSVCPSDPGADRRRVHCARLSLDGCGALGSALKTAARSLHVAFDASHTASCLIAREGNARGLRRGGDSSLRSHQLHADSFRDQ